MTFGLDVSRFQGRIDWSTVPIEMRQFVWVRLKGSENELGAFDPSATANFLGAASAGSRVGFYGFARWDENPIAWATELVTKAREIGWNSLNMRFLLDLEPPHNNASQAHLRAAFNKMSIEDRQKWAWDAAGTIAHHSGASPVIYTGYFVWKDLLGGDRQFALKYPDVVIANYSELGPHHFDDIPPGVGGWEPWPRYFGHQFTSSATIPGVENPRCDRIVLGTHVALDDLVAAVWSKTRAEADIVYNKLTGLWPF